MGIQSMPQRGTVWSEEEAIMSFFKDGDHLRIVAERLNGGSDEVYLSKEKAAILVNFIQKNATPRKAFVIA